MIHVYVGPTLSRDEPLLGAPSVRVLPPVRHGDLFDPVVADSDTVVLIDGVYHQAPALRHKEILAALARGVRVIGAASIGALRAVELHPFGMLGVGAVFRAYVRGDIDGDDEVAVGQEPGGGLRALTWPLVNVRQVLEATAYEGVVTGRTASGLLEALRAVYYPQRTMAAVRAVCRRHRAASFTAWLDEQRAADPHFGDLKRLDALEAVRTALDSSPPSSAFSVPAPSSENSGQLAEAHWDTGYFRKWVNHFAVQRVGGVGLPTAHRVAYQQIFDPKFPGVWLAHLDHLSRRPGGGRPGMPLAERMARLTGERPSPLPAHAVFRPPVDLCDTATVARLLAGKTAADRAAVARYERSNAEARRAHPGFCPEAIEDGVTRRTLLALWRCGPGRLEDEAAARGFRGSAHAAEEMKRFMAGFLHDRMQAASVRKPKEPVADVL